MKRKTVQRLLTIILSVAMILSVVGGTLVTSFAEITSISGNDFTIPVTTKYELKNWQQTVSPWGEFVVLNGKSNVGSTGDGIMALCNAVHYATGYFMAPHAVAEWANRAGGYDGTQTVAKTLYSNFFTTLGGQLGVKTVNSTESGVLQSVTSSSKTDVVNVIKKGGTAVAHVNSHFVSIVDYNTKSDKFLVWNGKADNNITHTAGDWFTWSEIQTKLKNFDYYVPVMLVEGKQRNYLNRTEIAFGSTILQTAGESCNFTPVNFSMNGGNKLTIKGTFTAPSDITAVGYKLDSKAVTWCNDSITTPSSSAKADGEKMVGSGSYSKSFEIKVPVSSATKRVDVMIGCGGATESVWVLLPDDAVIPVATPVPTAKPTAKPTAVPTAVPTEKATATPNSNVTTAPDVTDLPIATENSIATEDPSATLPNETEIASEIPTGSIDPSADVTQGPIETPTQEPGSETENPAAETTAPADATEEPGNGNPMKKGCKSAIAICPVAVIALIVVTVILLRKKKTNN